MRDDPYASLILVILEPDEGEGEDRDLFDILDRMHLAPEDYRTSDEFWNEYESELQQFSADLLKRDRKRDQDHAEETSPIEDQVGKKGEYS